MEGGTQTSNSFSFRIKENLINCMPGCCCKYVSSGIRQQINSLIMINKINPNVE